ncbi:DNA mismatch repair endonuclease MutH [Paraglaciecola aquimarina]|uniref:DNA mismatch repair protein MutH n=1 Tax=Paraglaciecola aquimarina TaxID=1235557 RepID=A0ABU3SVE8_9ALTE|nr:DNA mismatch repair endonuclease MutH [Paraglaciecola aquimarina]MDU0353966.1 DNA mismatch repair endonuclease MutH [Paraglaciecola aquimarina]
MKQYIFPNQEPKSTAQLMSRAETLAGLTLGELADINKIKVPVNFKREKGWTGQLLERCLGATAGSKSEQDFAKLGIELKTIPIDENCFPLETTYVCYAPLLDVAGIEWRSSNVRNKIQQVLWVPIDGRREIPPRDRRIATPFLWTPSSEQDHQLRMDWEELMEMISLGNIENITAKHGQYLQIRPKAADGSALTDAIGKNGQKIQTRPRGFYLRKEFTSQLLADYFGL